MDITKEKTKAIILRESQINFILTILKAEALSLDNGVENYPDAEMHVDNLIKQIEEQTKRG